MKVHTTLSLLFVMALGVSSLHAEMLYHNEFQEIEVRCVADNSMLDTFKDDTHNGSLDTSFNLLSDAFDGDHALAWGGITTTYSPDCLEVDMWATLEAQLLNPGYSMVSSEVHVYYQTLITITDQPTWVMVSYEFAPADVVAIDHFFILAPVWGIDTEYDPEYVMNEEAFLLDVGDHYFYGAVHYELTSDNSIPQSIQPSLHISLCVIPEPASLCLLTLGCISVVTRHRRHTD